MWTATTGQIPLATPVISTLRVRLTLTVIIQDPLAAYVEDNDVSAADFCLNLQLDGNNADGDSNGATGVETDWRLPTQKELMQAYIDGAANNVPNPAVFHWSSTEYYGSQSIAWIVTLYGGSTNFNTKDSSGSYYVRCVRRD